MSDKDCLAKLDTERILLKTHLYHCMTLVDLVLGGNTRLGAGTCRGTIMVDVDRAKGEVHRLQAIEARRTTG